MTRVNLAEPLPPAAATTGRHGKRDRRMGRRVDGSLVRPTDPEWAEWVPGDRRSQQDSDTIKRETASWGRILWGTVYRNETCCKWRTLLPASASDAVIPRILIPTRQLQDSYSSRSSLAGPSPTLSRRLLDGQLVSSCRSLGFSLTKFVWLQYHTIYSAYSTCSHRSCPPTTPRLPGRSMHG